MMASLLVVFLLFLTHFASVEAEKNSSKLISIGSSLSTFSPNNSWLSASGFFAFGFYRQGNGFAVGIWLVGQPNNTVVWTANRDNPPVSSNSTIEFTTNGWLILRTDQGTKVNVTDVIYYKSAMFASMLDSGNFVLYGSNDSSPIWQSFDYPTDTILGGQTFGARNLVSSVQSSSDHASGRFVLKKQNEGILAYPINCSHDLLDAYWATGISGNVELNLSSNGILFLRRCEDSSSYSISNSKIVRILANSSSSLAENKNTIYRATLDDDGIFRLYSHSFLSNITKRSNVSIKWSALKDHCQVHTFCGFNSYCSSNGTSTSEATCHCYPGFVFVDPSNKFLGCFRNFSEDICRNEKYNILNNVSWGGHSYSLISMNKKEDCGKSCSEDCNCGGALYFSGVCRKHKLPLRYGTINSSDSVTAFFKVISGTAKIPYQSPGNTFSPTSTVVTEDRRHLISILAISLGSITCLCFVIAISSFFLYRHRVHTYKKLSDSTAKMGLTEDFTLRSFSYSELEKATEGFKEELGKGSFGTVYKGTLSSTTASRGNKIVAVKRLENVLEEGEREFQSEVTAIGRTHHKNLVRLLGYCVEGPRKLLVYEYMSNGSLADILFNAEGCYPSWKERVNIALDIARGILYLHEECEACIIHCGIKPQNILMDDSWTAKISDFGFAKLLLMPNHIRRSIITGGVRGTKSYFAPEWQKDALISVKADIYSFGIVLLEVICCRSNMEVNVSNPDEIILSTWVYDCFVAGELQRLVGDEKVQVNTLQRMVKVGLWCIQDDPSLRPSMKKVILMLDGTVDIPVPPHPSPSLKH